MGCASSKGDASPQGVVLQVTAPMTAPAELEEAVDDDTAQEPQRRHRKLKTIGQDAGIISQQAPGGLDTKVREMLDEQGMDEKVIARVMELRPALKYAMLQGYKQMEASKRLSQRQPTGASQRGDSARQYESMRPSISEEASSKSSNMSASGVSSDDKAAGDAETPRPVAVSEDGDLGTPRAASVSADASEWQQVAVELSMCARQPSPAAASTSPAAAPAAGEQAATESTAPMGPVAEEPAEVEDASEFDTFVEKSLAAGVRRAHKIQDKIAPSSDDKVPEWFVERLASSEVTAEDLSLLVKTAKSKPNEWATRFLLLGGLDALSRPLERSALPTEPTAEDVLLRDATISACRTLLAGQLMGMVALISDEEEMETLRKACGVKVLSASAVAEEGSKQGSSPLYALALCVGAPKEAATAAQLDAMLLLRAAAEDSAEAHAMVLGELDRVAAVRGDARRFDRLVGNMRPPPSAEVSASEATAYFRMGERTMALINTLISSPAPLAERQALREEFGSVGLPEKVEVLRAVASAASDPPQLLAEQLDLFAEERAADELEHIRETAPLEEFADQCVVLYSSITGTNPLATSRWRKLKDDLEAVKVGYSAVDGALPARRKAREALWGISGERSYPQVFVNKSYVGNHDTIGKMLEVDEERKEAAKRLEARMPRTNSGSKLGGEVRSNKLPGQSFEATFGPFVGKPSRDDAWDPAFAP